MPYTMSLYSVVKFLSGKISNQKQIICPADTPITDSIIVKTLILFEKYRLAMAIA